MPTQPYEPLLNRDISKVILKPVMDIASPLLQEVINYATNLYQRCQTSKEAEGDESYPVLASYLHIIQITDSIEVLLSNGCGASANLLLRSSFEGKLTVLYILEKRTKRKNRANAWLLKNILDKIDSLKAYNPSDSKGKEFLETHINEDFAQIMGLPPFPDPSSAIKAFEDNLKKPEYTETYNEYKRLKKKGTKYPQWYSLYDGPRDLRQLSIYLNQEYWYQILYPTTSRMLHISSADHLTFSLKEGGSFLGPIRNPMYIVRTSAAALSILLEASIAMIKAYRSGEMTSFSNWYDKEVKERHMALVKMEISEVQWFKRKFIDKD